MPLTPQVFLIVCPMLFLAGLVDAIGGGGGLISLPAYLLAGLPVHRAIATNKLSSACGTALTTVRFIRQGLVNWKIAVPTIVCAMAGSSLGANLSLMVADGVMERVLFLILPVVAFIVMNPRIFHDNDPAAVRLDRKLWITAIASSFLVGLYDGFYGPGTGTFLIIAFTVFARLDIRTANAQAKVINLTTNITSLVIFLRSGQTVILLGLTAAACNMAGNFLGSGLAFVAGGMNVIYRIERLPLMVVILIHGIVLYSSYLVTYLLNSWLQWGIVPVLVFTAIFVLGYLVIWAIIYCVIRRNTATLNKALKEKQQRRENPPLPENS